MPFVFLTGRAELHSPDSCRPEFLLHLWALAMALLQA
jgi:hypothetical protein